MIGKGERRKKILMKEKLELIKEKDREINKNKILSEKIKSMEVILKEINDVNKDDFLKAILDKDMENILNKINEENKEDFFNCNS